VATAVPEVNPVLTVSKDKLPEPSVCRTFPA
jgi:hypothetical protein